VVNANDEVVGTFVTARMVQNLTVSSAEITTDEDYTVRSGGTSSGASIGGLAASGSVGSAQTIATVTAGEAPVGGGGGGRR